jgi:small subunit ribosomal protein S1
MVELSRDYSGDGQPALQAETEIEAKITSIERKNRRITLSIKALETELEGQAIKEYSVRDGEATTTLGEKLKEQLSRHEDAEDEEGEDDSD